MCLAEPVDLYYERYPALADVYCYSSDYPHVGGGKRSIDTFAVRLERFGDQVIHKFFRANAELIMPASRTRDSSLEPMS